MPEISSDQDPFALPGFSGLSGIFYVYLADPFEWFVMRPLWGGGARPEVHVYDYFYEYRHRMTPHNHMLPDGQIVTWIDATLEGYDALTPYNPGSGKRQQPFGILN